MHKPIPACLAVLAAGLVLASAPASAVDIFTASANAGNACQPAMPAYEGAIRKRPLAVQNEGSTSAFVTCAFSAFDKIGFAYIYGSSIDGQAHTITCTGVSGRTGNAKYATRNLAVNGSGSGFSLYFLPQDFSSTGNLGSELLSLSCLLPAGTALNDMYVKWEQYIEP